MLRRLLYAALIAGALAAIVLATGGLIGVSVPARAALTGNGNVKIVDTIVVPTAK